MERENLATGSLFILLGNCATTLQVAKKECEAFFGIGRWANSFLCAGPHMEVRCQGSVRVARRVGRKSSLLDYI
jgi:hypothetical protein